jgi:LysM repeat protein
MKASYASKALYFLVLVLLVAGLAGCERRAEEREVETREPVATSEATQEAGEQQTAMPGETVVSAVTPTSQEIGTVVSVTQPPAAETSVPGPGTEATPVPTEQAPATAEPESSAQQSGVVWHTVQRGETLASIGRRYGTTWQAISQANDLVNPNQIYVGQKLKIPSGSTGSSASSGATGCRIRHTVKSGEWVWQIARNYGVSPYDILAANGLTIQTANTIYAGMVLCIP